MISSKSKRIFEFIIDEALFKVGSKYVWLWVATIEPGNNEILALSISKERKVVVVERFILILVMTYESILVSTDLGTRYPPQACRFLKL